MTTTPTSVRVNGTDYRWPLRPVVAVCIDGGDPRYLQRFLADGSIPNIARFISQGFAGVADGSMPSFTCPNNMSLITGTPTAQHGISGNYYLDTATWHLVLPLAGQRSGALPHLDRIEGLLHHQQLVRIVQACNQLMPVVIGVRRTHHHLQMRVYGPEALNGLQSFRVR